MNYLIVFVGAGLGGAVRYGFNVWIPRLAGGSFPWHTLVINVLGSTLMGLIAGYFAFRGNLPPAWQLFLTTGILGGYTTFSAFSLDTVALYERGQLAAAAFYVAASVVLSIAGLFAGLAVIRQTVSG